MSRGGTSRLDLGKARCSLLRIPVIVEPRIAQFSRCSPHAMEPITGIRERLLIVRGGRVHKTFCTGMKRHNRRTSSRQRVEIKRVDAGAGAGLTPGYPSPPQYKRV